MLVLSNKTTLELLLIEIHPAWKWLKTFYMKDYETGTDE
jgi:hypothetical protein